MFPWHPVCHNDQVSFVTTLWRCHDLRVPPNYRAAHPARSGQAARSGNIPALSHTGGSSPHMVTWSHGHMVTWSHAGQSRVQGDPGSLWAILLNQWTRIARKHFWNWVSRWQGLLSIGKFDHFIDITLYWYHEDNGHWELDNVVLFVVISGQPAVWPI